MRRLVFLLVSLGFAVVAASASSTTAGTPLSPKLRGDLAALVAGETTLDARIPDLIPGLEAGEIPFFAVLSEPNDLGHRTQLEGLGARVLRTYRSVDAFALVSDARTVSEVAALPWVDWLAPIEVVEALNHEAEVGDVRNTPADVGANQFWDADVTGGGVRIAVLDTGLVLFTRISTTSTSATGCQALRIRRSSTTRRSSIHETSTAASVDRPRCRPTAAATALT